jgi:hypothetical protein
VPDVHRIRLREPWEAEPLPDGRTRYTRRFGRPTNLGKASVWLVLEGRTTPAEVWLNGEWLGELDRDWGFEVTGRLAERNGVEMRTTGELGEVALEVRGDG